MPSKPQAPPEVFVSYSHVDEEYKNELVKRLDVLKDQSVIAHWHDGLLKAGERWNDEIVKRLNSSRVILFLISVDFLTSVYINEIEIEHASRRYQAGEIIVIPVLVRKVHGWNQKPFGDIKLGALQALPGKSKFIANWRNRDDAFAEVAAGIQKAVEGMFPHGRVPKTTLASPASDALSAVPTSHQTDYVRRHDEKGRDTLERLKAELAPGMNRLVALWGKGGMGKTRIAAEVATALTASFGSRVVWTSAEKRTDFTLSTLLDEIGKQLGEPEVLKLPQDSKEEAVRNLLVQLSTVVILDNFETIGSSEERDLCIGFLAERARCPSLITSRDKISSSARNIPLKGMSTKEAQELLSQAIEQTQEQKIFTRQVRNQIIETAESNPYIMLWMVGQIDEAQTPRQVFDELEQGKGTAAERVFDRSFNLPQLGEDGRAALLALTLFVPDASRDALAEIAGFGNDLSRLDEGVRNLRKLWLIGASDENQRLSVEGLTRSQARARLQKDEMADEFRQRFVACFKKYAEAHNQATAEDYQILENEKENLLNAMDVAFATKDWSNVMDTRSALEEFLDVHGYWNDAIRSGEQALVAARESANESSAASFAHNLAIIEHRQGELAEARRLYYESLEISKRLGNQSGIASTLQELGRLAQDEGELAEARRLYHESLEIKKRLGNQSGIAITLHQLAMMAQDEGELAEARQLYHESLEIANRLGDSRGIASTLQQLGGLAQREGELAEARRLYQESLEIKQRLGDQNGIAITLHQLAMMAQTEGELAEARRLYQESLEIKQRLGDQNGIAITLHQLAMMAQTEGELAEARRLYQESLEIAKRLGDQLGIALTLGAMGTLAENENNCAEAARLFEEALVTFDKLKSPFAEIARRSLERVKGKLS